MDSLFSNFRKTSNVFIGTSKKVCLLWHFSTSATEETPFPGVFLLSGSGQTVSALSSLHLRGKAAGESAPSPKLSCS